MPGVSWIDDMIRDYVDRLEAAGFETWEAGIEDDLFVAPSALAFGTSIAQPLGPDGDTGEGVVADVAFLPSVTTSLSFGTSIAQPVAPGLVGDDDQGITQRLKRLLEKVKKAVRRALEIIRKNMPYTGKLDKGHIKKKKQALKTLKDLLEKLRREAARHGRVDRDVIDELTEVIRRIEDMMARMARALTGGIIGGNLYLIALEAFLLGLLLFILWWLIPILPPPP